MGKKYKLPLAAGFAALCGHIKAIKQTAEQSGSAVSALAEATAASVEEIEGALDGKQDKISGSPGQVVGLGDSGQPEPKSLEDIGAATKEDVAAAIQSAILASWEKSYG